jgi:hypothetical protein
MCWVLPRWIISDLDDESAKITDKNGVEMTRWKSARPERAKAKPRTRFEGMASGREARSTQQPGTAGNGSCDVGRRY